RQVKKELQVINISGPRNMADEVIQDTFDVLDYRSVESCATLIRDIMLTTSGGVFKRWLPVLRSYYSHRPQLYQHLAINYGNVLKRRRITLPADRMYTSGHNMWSGGYFHWITESLPRLIQAFEVDNDVT